nr:efflux RND transporter periplasmic adaptor subunit [Pantoea sp. 1.19]
MLLLLTAAAVWLRPSTPQKNWLTATVVQRDMQQTVLADGTLSASKQVSVGAQASGQVKRLLVSLGDTVTAGQLVAEIDSMTQQNDLRNAQAALKNVQAQRASKSAMLTQYRATLARQRAMLAGNLTARADYDAALANVLSTEADIQALDAQIVQADIAASTAGVNLGYTRITSPIDGTVVATPVEAGQTVNAVQSAPTIIKVADLNTMTVKARISEADVVNVRPGMSVWFTIPGQPDKRYRATLRAIEPAPDAINTDTSTAGASGSNSTTSSAIYYYGLFDVANPQHILRISMTAEVHILIGEAKNALVIPSSALTLNGDRYSVRVLLDGDRTEHRPVTPGMNNNIEAQILSGLQPGEKVVLGEADAGSPDGPSRGG